MAELKYGRRTWTDLYVPNGVEERSLRRENIRIRAA